MSRFASTGQTALKGPVTTTTPAATYEGGQGFSRDAKSELFLLAVTNLVGKDTFYESANARDQRFVALLRQVVIDDPQWVQGFLPWLRNEANMRTASVVGAIEYARAGGDNAREVIANTLRRGDEPAEALAYFLSKHGRRIPKSIKKGIADAAVKIYDELTYIKYASRGHAVQPGDVIALTHPKPKDPRQSAVFTALLDRRHGHKPKPETLELLPKISANLAFHAGESSDVADAGTWEQASAKGKVDWDKMVDSMGYMALLRNLRNFDNDGISDKTYDKVVQTLTHPDEVAHSRQFPLRFLSAWKAVEGMRWGQALEQALELSVSNIPVLGGRTLILWDCSASMTFESIGQAAYWEVAGVFAVALAKRCENVDLVPYSNNHGQLGVTNATSVLRTVAGVRSERALWSGTATWQVLSERYDNHDRVIIVTDEQAATMNGYAQAINNLPACSYILNVAGYEPASVSSDKVVTFGGLSDKAFWAIEQIEKRSVAGWPWEDGGHV